MKRLRSKSLLPFLLVVFFWSCKTSSQLSKSNDTKNKKSSETAEFPEGEEMESDQILDLSHSMRQNLENYFSEFSKLDIKDQNKRQTYLNKGLKYFNSTDTPVLIIVNKENGKFIYDKPTSIEQYLDYLKYKQMSPHVIHNLQLDEEGKITQLELMVK